jgi:hypothetical protein
MLPLPITPILDMERTIRTAAIDEIGCAQVRFRSDFATKRIGVGASAQPLALRAVGRSTVDQSRIGHPRSARASRVRLHLPPLYGSAECGLRVSLLVAIMFALPACGGEGGEPRVSTPTATPTAQAATGAMLSKAEYERRFTAALQRYDDRAIQLREPLESAFQNRDPERIAQVLGDFGESMRIRANELATVRPPSDIAAEHDGYVALLRETARKYEQLAQAVAEAPTLEVAQARYAALLRLVLGRKKADPRAVVFHRAAQRGGYELRLKPSNDTSQEQPSAP